MFVRHSWRFARQKMAGYDPVESRKLVAASWARAEAQLDAVRTAFHAKLQEIDKTAAKLFAGTCRNVPALSPVLRRVSGPSPHARVSVLCPADQMQEERTGASFFNLLRVIVAQMETPDSLTPVLKDIGRIQNKYGSGVAFCAFVIGGAYYDVLYGVSVCSVSASQAGCACASLQLCVDRLVGRHAVDAGQAVDAGLAGTD